VRQVGYLQEEAYGLLKKPWTIYKIFLFP